MEFTKPSRENLVLREQLDTFHEYKRKEIIDGLEFENKIRKILNSISVIPKMIKGVGHFDAHSIFALSTEIMRVYATDWNVSVANLDFHEIKG
jgi:hypothetical protein